MPKCPTCEKEMTDHSKPQDPFFICEDCECDESGLEIDFCDCGTPFVCGDDKRCECEEYGEDYGDCEECDDDYYDDDDDEEED